MAAKDQRQIVKLLFDHYLERRTFKVYLKI